MQGINFLQRHLIHPPYQHDLCYTRITEFNQRWDGMEARMLSCEFWFTIPHTVTANVDAILQGEVVDEGYVKCWVSLVQMGKLVICVRRPKQRSMQPLEITFPKCKIRFTFPKFEFWNVEMWMKIENEEKFMKLNSHYVIIIIMYLCIRVLLKWKRGKTKLRGEQQKCYAKAAKWSTEVA